ncbi:MAG: 30S ribosomal protein S8 [archaeon]
MSQDIVADGLNQIMNAVGIGKREIRIKKYSKVLINILEMMSAKNHISYEVNENDKTVTVKVIKLNECRAVKPRYYVGVENIDRYLRRFLPSRNFGSLIISTNKGLINYKEAIANKIGGSVIAYFY